MLAYVAAQARMAWQLAGNMFEMQDVGLSQLGIIWDRGGDRLPSKGPASIGN